MPIEVTTTLDEERLKRFYRCQFSRNKPFWVFAGICTAFAVLCAIFGAVVNILSPMLIWSFCLLLFMDALVVTLRFIVPLASVKKNSLLNAVIRYTFGEDQFSLDGENTVMRSSATLHYSILKKIIRRGNDVYLFNRDHQAYIVDLSGLSEEQTATLRELWKTKVKPGKFKWAE